MRASLPRLPAKEAHQSGWWGSSFQARGCRCGPCSDVRLRSCLGHACLLVLRPRAFVILAMEAAAFGALPDKHECGLGGSCTWPCTSSRAAAGGACWPSTIPTALGLGRNRSAARAAQKSCHQRAPARRSPSWEILEMRLQGRDRLPIA